MESKNKFLVIIIVVLLLSFLLYLSSALYQIFALSFIVAFFVKPLKNRLLKKIKSENLVSALCMIIGFLILVAFLGLFFASIYNSVSGLINSIGNNEELEIITKTMELVQSYNIEEPLTEAGLKQVSNLLQNIILFVPQLLVSIIVFLFFLFYFIKYGEEIMKAIRGLIPPAEMKYFDKLLKRVSNMMRAIFQGQFITALVQSIVLLIFMLVMNAPFAIELTFFTFIMCFLGITVAIVPVGLNIYYGYLGFLSGNFTLFIISIIFTLFITTIDNIIKPIIGEKAADMNPVLSVLGLLGGALTLGATGFIIGPMVFGMLQATMEIYYSDKNVHFT